MEYMKQAEFILGNNNQAAESSEAVGKKRWINQAIGFKCDSSLFLF
jgi:hypothetical protein